MEQRERLSIIAGLVGVALLLVIGVLASSRVWPAEAGVMAKSCSFDSITVTAALGLSPGVSDTLPGDANSRGVYFSNPASSGALTISFLISTLAPSCYVWASPAFSVTEQRQFTLTAPVLTKDIAYTVSSQHGPAVTVLLTSSENITGSILPPHQVVTLTFMQDNVPPTSTAQSPALHYGLGPIPVRWEADDTGSGAATARLYYIAPTATGWLSSGPAQISTTGTFYFTPTSFGIYTFTTQTTDQVGNQEALSVKTWTLVKQVYVYLPVVLRDFPPIWKQGANTDNIHVRAPSGCGSNIWYAGTWDAGMWKSTDNARTWTKIAGFSSNPYPVVANRNNCNQVFGSVWQSGIYSITGSLLQQVNNGLGELSVYGLAMTGTTIYAGTDTQGVYKTNSPNIVWQAVNTNIDDRRIRSVTVIGNRLYAGARACSLYISENGGTSWSKQTVLTSGCDDAQVWSITEVRSTRYAGLGLGKGLYYNVGSVWQKVSAVPNNTVYGLAYDETNGYLYVSTNGSGIYRCSVDGTGAVQECDQYNSGLTTLNMREIKIHNELLAAGSDDGFWYLPLFR